MSDLDKFSTPLPTLLEKWDGNIDDLLPPEERERLNKVLAEMARARARAWAESYNKVIG